MSQLRYNNISLQIIKTNFVERTPVYSDDNTEYLYTDFIIDLNCIYNPYATTFAPGGFPALGYLAPETDVNIRHYLAQPRKELLYLDGDTVLLQVQALNVSLDAVDSANGPLPLAINIQRIIGSKTFFVNYKIKCSVVECPAGYVQVALASNRYSIKEEIDDQYKSTITTTGIAIFKSNVLQFLAQNADIYRAAIIPPKVLGYQRIGLSVNIDSSGLRIDWSTTDKELMQDIGSPQSPGTAGAYGITKIEGTYGVTSISNGPLGFAGFGAKNQVALRCWGSKLSNNFDMFTFLFRVAQGKLPIADPQSGYWLQDAAIMESIFDRYVELNMTYVTLVNENNAANNMRGVGNVRIKNMGIPIIGNQTNGGIDALPVTNGDNPSLPFGGGTRGTHPIELALNAFRVSCTSYLGTPPYTNNYDPNANVSVTSGGPTPYQPGGPGDIPTQQTAYKNRNYSKYSVKVKKHYMSEKEKRAHTRELHEQWAREGRGKPGFKGSR